jgi:uracil-DNA glycosylase
MINDQFGSLRQVNAAIVACEKCPRLRRYCAAVAKEKRRAFREDTYWGKPVPGFGDPNAHLLIVGLAPAAHGGNRTGRMFTGDRSGDFSTRRCTARDLPTSRSPDRAATACN